MYTPASWWGFGVLRRLRFFQEKRECRRERRENNSRCEGDKKAITWPLRDGIRVFLPVKQTQPVNTTAVWKAPYLPDREQKGRVNMRRGQTRSDSRLSANISCNQEGRFSAAANPAHSSGGGETFGIVSYFYSCLLTHVIPFSHNQSRI